MSKNEKFIMKAKQIHGDKYNYSLIDYKNNSTKIKIICDIHGIFEQNPNNHLNGNGCKKCFFLNRTKSIDVFINEANEIHDNKYNYSCAIYINNKTKIHIKCPAHGSFWQKPNDHLEGKGCRDCGIEKTNQLLKHDSEKFIEKANKIHNNKYDYSCSNYVSNKVKIKIKCKRHGIFEQTPNSHLSGYGCFRCRESKGERKIVDYLQKQNINFIQEYRFKNCKNKNPLPFDFYLPDYNCCIEYDGEHHFEPVFIFGGKEKFNKYQINDSIKNNFCIKNNIKLLRIKYTEINEIEIKLRNILVANYEYFIS